jgi:hypothetical protein
MLRVGFGDVKTLAIRNQTISKLYQLSGLTVAPTAYRMLCVRFTRFVRQHELLTPLQVQHSIRVGG